MSNLKMNNVEYNDVENTRISISDQFILKHGKGAQDAAAIVTPSGSIVRYDTPPGSLLGNAGNGVQAITVGMGLAIMNNPGMPPTIISTGGVVPTTNLQGFNLFPNVTEGTTIPNIVGSPSYTRVFNVVGLPSITVDIIPSSTYHILITGCVTSTTGTSGSTIIYEYLVFQGIPQLMDTKLRNAGSPVINPTFTATTNVGNSITFSSPNNGTWGLKFDITRS